MISALVVKSGAQYQYDTDYLALLPIIMSNYRDEVLRWEIFLHKVDQVYLSEFAVANRNEKLPNHFKSWDM